MDNDKRIILDYYEKYCLPIIHIHLKLRSTGLQVFTAIQGVLLIGWVNKQNVVLILLGLGSTLSFALWDARNRFIFITLRDFGEKHVDRNIFGIGEDGKAKDGINKLFLQAVNTSGKFKPGKHFASHTWAIRTLIFLSFFLWVLLALSQIF